MTYILPGLFFYSSFNHVLLTFVPFNQLFDQLRIHDYNPIHRFSMIYFGDHHGKFVAKVLHLIFLIDNGQNRSNPINILKFHFLNNPSFIGVVSIWNPINYVCSRSSLESKIKIRPTCSLVFTSLLCFLKLCFLKVFLQSLLFFLIASKVLSNLNNKKNL